MPGGKCPVQVGSDRLRLSSAAKDAPNAIALVLDGCEISFSELWGRTQPWLARLPESTIALSAQPRLEELLVLYACLELGRTVLLLHPRWTESESRHVVAQVAEIAPYQAGSFQTIRSDSAIVPETQDQVILTTSGTTGPPKLVPLSRDNLLAAVESHALNLPFEEADRWLLALPFAHIGGLSILLRSLWARTTVVIAQSSKETLGQQIQRNQISLLSVVPTQLCGLLSEVARLRSVRAILVGGAKAPPSLRSQADASGLPVLYTYGMTEAASQVCSQSLARIAPEPSDSVGKPLEGLEVRTTASGRIELRGPQVFRGYLGEARGRDSSEWFETSDSGEIQDDGSLVVVGRIDDLIISGGENVSPDLVEQALLDTGMIQSACVVGVEHPKWGQMVVALVVPLQEQAKWRQQCQYQLVQNLADYARPKELIEVERLPALSSGKPDRRQALAFAQLYLKDAH